MIVRALALPASTWLGCHGTMRKGHAVLLTLTQECPPEARRAVRLSPFAAAGRIGSSLYLVTVRAFALL